MISLPEFENNNKSCLHIFSSIPDQTKRTPPFSDNHLVTIFPTNIVCYKELNNREKSFVYEKAKDFVESEETLANFKGASRT